MKRVAVTSLGFLAAALAFAGAVGLAKAPHRGPGLLPADIAVFALLGVAAVIARRAYQTRWPAWTVWLACGALLGATGVVPLKAAAWTFTATLAFGLAGILSGFQERRRMTAVLAVVILAAVANFGVLWAFVYGTHRQAAPAAYASLDLRAHSFLADVPLHDVWVARLPGGGPGRTILDVQRLFSERGPDDVCPAIAVLAGVRYVLGQLFGWDDERFDVPAASYVHRLTEADRSHALDEPGDHLWAFRSIYSFEREAVGEIINGTVHAFLAVALDRTENGYVLFLAIYVKPVSGFTPTYMSLIDPFRRLFVYPWLLENLERDWSRRWGAAAGESPVRSSRSDG